MELLIARNPDPDSSLPYLLRIPIASVPLLRIKDTWPRTTAVYCHPIPDDEWPADPEIVERMTLRSCVRRGAAIDIVVDRTRENRSQIVFTKARGRDMVFWQSPKTRKQSRPNVSVSHARASGVASLEIAVDTRERYAWNFSEQHATTTKTSLPCGDYAVFDGERILAAVERKSMSDLVSSMTNGRLRYAMTDLASLPLAAVVVEDQYSKLLDNNYVGAAQAADGLAELAVRYPSVPVVFCQTRKLAQEYTYRFLAAATVHLTPDADLPVVRTTTPRPAKGPTIRAWARANGYEIGDRGIIPAPIRAAYEEAHK